MTGILTRISAIIRADFLIRFRRLSTAVIFVGLFIAAYMWIPDPSTGRALLQMQERRALYNSPALALATSSLCTILLTLIGYYMVSNSVKRDIRTRTGYIIASTTVGNMEYIVGKFFGNVVFLSTIYGGFMLSSMVMQLVRGEAPLEPLVFLKHYIIMVPPSIVFVAAVGVFFECTRFLSGKFGDIVYFFVWMFAIAFVAIAEDKGITGGWHRYLDVTGMAFMIHQVKTLTGSDSVAIGSSEYDMTQSPFVFEGYHVTMGDGFARLVAGLWPMIFLLPALLFFHRFNPARLKGSSQKSHYSLVGRINRWMKPVTRRLLAPFSISSSHDASFTKSVWADTVLTLQLNPMAVLLSVGFAIASFLKPPSSILPVILAVLSVILSDIATRERNTGVRGIVFASPFLKTRFVLWKWASTFLIVLLFILVPLAKMALTGLSSALSLLIGATFIAAASTSLGIMTANPKTFVVSFLLFWYIALNAGGSSAYLDFAGWFGTATPIVQATYAILAVGFLALAELQYRWQLQRRF